MKISYRTDIFLLIHIVIFLQSKSNLILIVELSNKFILILILINDMLNENKRYKFNLAQNFITSSKKFKPTK